MPNFIPLTPSDTNYRMRIPIDDAVYLFDVRWNSRDKAFYLDIRREDEAVILLNIKCVLGINLGRSSAHPFFRKHLFRLFDTTEQGVEAKYDDIGKRVVLAHYTSRELFTMGE